MVYLSAYLVVRTEKSITMLHLLYKTGLTTGYPFFSARCVAVIDTQMVGGDSFLHFAVNPWLGSQIAILDINGGWSLWNLTLKRSYRTSMVQTTAHKYKAGSLLPNGTISWARIAWGRSQDELIVATRHELLKINVEVGAFVK